MKTAAKNIIWSVITISFGIIFFAIAALLLFWTGKSGYQFGNSVFNEKAVSEGLGKEILVDIGKDMTDRDVSKYIKKMGLVEDENVFFVQIMLSDYKKQYKPGTYMLNTNMKPTEILETICSGEFYVEPEPIEPENPSEGEEDTTEGTQTE